jgi:hypothetical protein
MEFPETGPETDSILVEASTAQLRHFQQADPNCRALQLPEGILLRYTQATSLYFYLHSVVKEGKLTTRVFASDSPYERQKMNIGEVFTPMFEPQADHKHLVKLEQLLRAWVEFVRDDPNAEQPFRSFSVDNHPE